MKREQVTYTSYTCDGCGQEDVRLPTGVILPFAIVRCTEMYVENELHFCNVCWLEMIKHIRVMTGYGPS